MWVDEKVVKTVVRKGGSWAVLAAGGKVVSRADKLGWG